MGDIADVGGRMCSKNMTNLQARKTEAEWRQRLEEAGQGSGQILATERHQWELLKGNLEGELDSLAKSLERVRQQAAEDLETVERYAYS